MITKENLINFIANNYDELVRGGCANWSQLNNSEMTVKEFDDCEKIIGKLLMKKHAGTSDTYMSIWAVRTVLGREVFGSDPFGDDVPMFRNRYQAEKYAENESGAVIEYIFNKDHIYEDKDNMDAAYKCKWFLEKYGYVARRVVARFRCSEDYGNEASF